MDEEVGTDGGGEKSGVWNKDTGATGKAKETRDQEDGCKRGSDPLNDLKESEGRHYSRFNQLMKFRAHMRFTGIPVPVAPRPSVANPRQNGIFDEFNRCSLGHRTSQAVTSGSI
jgi:hypothetical protein